MQRFMLWITRWRADNWLTVVMICSLISALILKVKTHDRWAEAVFIPAGLIGLYLLVRLTKAQFIRIWHATLGKVVLGFFSLLVINGARIYADYQITVTTGASASLFPRAQDTLTLLISFILWIVLAFLALGILLLGAQLYMMAMMLASDWVKPAKLRVYFALKLLLIIFVVLFSVGIVSESVSKVEFNILEHAIVLSSFVPNQAVPLDLGPSAVAQLCLSEPTDAWLAFMGDGSVMVALPATPDAGKRAFTYRWGQCSHERQPGALSGMP